MHAVCSFGAFRPLQENTCPVVSIRMIEVHLNSEDTAVLYPITKWVCKNLQNIKCLMQN